MKLLSDKLLRLGHLELVNAHGTRNYFHDKNLNSLRNEAIEGVSSCYHSGVEVMYTSKEHIIRLTKINS